MDGDATGPLMDVTADVTDLLPGRVLDAIADALDDKYFDGPEAWTFARRTDDVVVVTVSRDVMGGGVESMRLLVSVVGDGSA
jgi:hypothetical protein